MFVLSRRIGQEIVIGNDIHLTVVAVEGLNVRIGVSAPKEVVVDRQDGSPCRSGGIPACAL